MDLVEFLRSTVLTGSMLAALPVAFLAGLISFGSPCVFPLLPGYVGYLSAATGSGVRSGIRTKSGTGSQLGNEGDRAGRDSSFGQANPEAAPVAQIVVGLSLFVLGFSAVFVTLGLAVASLGYVLALYLPVIKRLFGLVVILLGLGFTGLLPIGQVERRLRIDTSGGRLGALVLGVVFGLGWTPCIGPTLSAVLTLALDGANPLRGAILAVVYCLGLGLPFIALGAVFSRTTSAIGYLARHRLLISRLGAGLLITLGVLLLTGLWDQLVNWLAISIGGFEPVI